MKVRPFSGSADDLLLRHDLSEAGRGRAAAARRRHGDRFVDARRPPARRPANRLAGLERARLRGAPAGSRRAPRRSGRRPAPGRRACNSPASLETASTAAPVSTRTATMVAPGTGAPPMSATTPVICPPPTWALSTAPPAARPTHTTSHTRIRGRTASVAAPPNARLYIVCNDRSNRLESTITRQSDTVLISLAERPARRRRSFRSGCCGRRRVRSGPAGPRRAGRAAQRSTIAAASDLQTVFPELAARLRARHRHQGRPSRSARPATSSRRFRTARRSTSSSPPTSTIRGGSAPAATPTRATLYQYATGRIVLWTRKDSGIDVTRGLRVLRDATRPAHRHRQSRACALRPRGGRRAAEREASTTRCRRKLVLGENISQTAQLVDSGNADVAIIALSLALGPALRASGSLRRDPRDGSSTDRAGGIVISASRRQGAARTAVPRRIVQEDRHDAGDAASLRVHALRGGTDSLRRSPLQSSAATHHGLAGHLAHRQARGDRLGDSARHQPAARALADVLPPPLDVPVESVVSLPLVLPPTVLGFYLLMAMGSRSPIGRWWTALDRARAGVHVRRPGRRLGVLQPAVRGAADCRGVRAGRCARCARRRRRSARRAAHVPARHAAALDRRRHRRRRPELRAHGRRVRRRADGRRQPAGRHAHGLDRHLRPRAGAASIGAANQTALVLLAFSLLVLLAVYGLRRRPWAAAPTA